MRLMGVATQRPDFAEFYRSAADECLRAVLVSVGDQDTARDLVDEAFARAWASWRTLSRHPAPKAWVVRTALNTGISRWRRLRREVPVSDLATVTDRPAAGAAVASPVDPKIMAALMRLPARQRQVVALRLVLDPSALPSGTGVAIFDEPGTGLPPHPSPAVAPRGAPPLHPSTGSMLSGLDGPLAIGLVYASPQCTG
jgi:DNA-directed RNA polymerase specialized sigma24 family protein